MYKIDILLKQKQKLFHANDLALLWGLKNPNTLYTTIKRYVQKGILFRIHKGFYAAVSPAEIDPVRLGIGFLHHFVYLSCESVLAAGGIIFQAGESFTLISNISQRFSFGESQFLVRKMKDEFLYQPAGIAERDEIKTATVERAVADMLYFQPNYHFDNPSAINWVAVKKIQREVGFK